MTLGGSMFLTPFLNLVYVLNTGAAFSILAEANGWPNDRDETICCLGGATSSRARQLSPLSSETVLARTTLNSFLMRLTESTVKR